MAPAIIAPPLKMFGPMMLTDHQPRLPVRGIPGGRLATARTRMEIASRNI
jgi:hypothetical protein